MLLYKVCMKTSNKGFTLIELLIVIAIIGIISSIVLVSLSSAREKGSNASVKQSLSQFMRGAELFYDQNNTFAGVCADETYNTSQLYNAALSNAKTPTTNSRCNSAAGAYAVTIELKTPEGTNTHWCVDSRGITTGYSGTAIGAGVTQCP